MGETATAAPAEMPRNQAALNRLTSVYSGADAGHYTLPDDVKTARAAFQAVLAADMAARTVTARLNPDQVEGRAVEAILDAAEAGESILDPDKPPQWTADMLEARTEAERRAAEARALSEAAERAAVRLTSTVTDMAHITIEEHLRPALEQVIEVVERLRPRVSGLSFDQPERVIGMPSAMRSAWEGMTQVGTRYAALRSCQETLWRLLENPDLAMWRFIEMRSLHAVWPVAGTWQEQAPPWPKDPRARLVWLVERRDEAGLWCPTPEQARTAMAEQAKALSARVEVPVRSGG